MATTTDLLATLTVRGVDDLTPVLATETAALKDMAAVSTDASAKIVAGNTATATSYETAMRRSQSALIAVAADEKRTAAAAEAASVKIEAANAKAAASLSKFGLVLGGVAAAVVVFSAKDAIKFQQAMEMVHTQAGATQTEVNQLTPAILSLSSSVGTGPTSLAESLYHAESAGFRGAAALDMVKAAAMGAKIGNSDLQSTTQAMIATMASQIGGIKNATDAMAQLNAIVGTGDLRMQGLTLAMGTGILSTAATFGLALRDVGAALATMTDNAVPADEAATRLRMTIVLLGAPSGAASKALQAVGLSASEANAAFSHRDELAKYGVHLNDLSADLRKPQGLLVALEDIKKHLVAAGLSAEEQSAVLARSFGGGRSSTAIMTLMNELDRMKQKYADQAVLVKQFGKDWEATTQTSAFQTAQFAANVDHLKIAIGAGLLPALNSVLGPLDAGLKATADWATKNKDLTNAILATAAVLGTGALLAKGIVGTLALVDALKVSYERLRVAEIAAWAISPPGLIALAIGATALGVAALTKNLYDLRQQGESNRQKFADLEMQFIRGALTMDQFLAKVKGLKVESQEMARHVAEYDRAQYNAGQTVGGTTKSLDEQRRVIDSHRRSMLDNEKTTQSSTSTLEKHKNTIISVTDAYKKMGDTATSALSKANAAATAAQATLADALNKGVSGDALAKIEKWAIGQQHAADVWQSSFDKAGKIVQDALHKTSTAIHDYAADADTILAQHTIRQATSFTSWADSAIAQAKRLRDGVVSQVREMAKEVQIPLPMPGLSRPGFSPDRMPQVNAFMASNEQPHGTAGSALALSPEATAAMNSLKSSILGMPAAFRGDLQPVLDGFNGKLTALYNDYIDKVNKENLSFAEKVQKVYDDAAVKAKKLDDDAQAQLKRFYDQYLGNLKRIEDTYQSTLARNLATFTMDFSRVLAKFQADTASENIKAQNALSSHNQKLQTDLSEFNTKLAGIHGKHADTQRAALLDWYKRRVEADDRAYGLQIKGYTQHAQGITLAFDKSTGLLYEKLTTSDKTAADARDAAIAKGNKALQDHAKDVQKHLSDHTKDLYNWIRTHIAGLKGAHDDFLKGLLVTFTKGATHIAEQAAKANTPAAIVSGTLAGAQNAYKDATAQGTLDMIRLGYITKEHAHTIQVTGAALQKLQDDATAAGFKVKVHATSLDTAVVAVDNFSTALSKLNTSISDSVDRLAQYIFSGGKPGADDPLGIHGIRRAQSIGSDAQTVNPTKAILDDYLPALKETKDRTKALSDAQMYLARETGDYSVILAGTKKTLDDGVNTALDHLVLSIYSGAGATADLVASYQAALVSRKQLTDAETQAAALFGDASAKLAAQTKISTDAYKLALDGLVLKIHDHADITQADISAVVTARQQTEEWTKSMAEATYATASLAEKQKTLISMFSPTISQDSTVSGMQSSVQSADLAVLAAASAVEVNLLQQQVTATTDLAGIMSAQQKVSAAGFTGQLAAITDGTKIMQDVYAVQSATNPAMLRVAQDQLAIDRVTAMMHQADAHWQIRIAQDELTIAQHKAQIDQTNLQAQGTILMDQLKVAQDQRQLAIDQAQLTGDTLQVLDAINYNLGGSEDFGKMIAADLANINADRSNIYKDQSVLAQDQSAANVTAQQGAQTLANDTVQLTGDQGAAAQTSQQYQLQLAQMNQQMAADQIREKQLQTLQSLNTTANGLLAAAQKQIADNGAHIAALETLVRMAGEQPHTYVGGQTSSQSMSSLGGQLRTVQSH